MIFFSYLYIKYTTMKKLLSIFAFLPFAAISQMNLSTGAGLSVTHLNPQIFTEAGYQAGHGYIGTQVRYNGTGWNRVEIAPVVGVVGHWNNNKMHELTTMAFAKYRIPVIVQDKQVVKPAIGFGVRHHIYNAFVETCYVDGQVSVTIGLSLKNPFR
jgi:hypothetical protein